MESYTQTSILQYQAVIEAILFAAGEPVPIVKLAEMIGIEPAACRQQLEEMAIFYQEESRGIELKELDGAVQLCTKKKFSEEIKKAVLVRRDHPLSPVSMEVLAIIAYNQPVTKGFVEQVRGVNSSNTVNTLVEKGLIEEAGRLDLPGKPISYRTTSAFLRTFGLSSLSELPPLEEEEEQ